MLAPPHVHSGSRSCALQLEQPDVSFENRSIYVTILQMVHIHEYVNRDGRNLFGEWFDRLNSEAAR